jgi:predicted NAD/FAD-binding protein
MVTQVLDALPPRPNLRSLPVKVAIVGAGISGLTAVYLLRADHQITLFEAGAHLGGHTQTVDVTFDGEQHAIDTGFIVFNRRTYPRFNALLDELGVKSRPTSMGFSVRCDRTGLEYCASSLAGLFCQKRNLFRPRFYQMLRDIWRFNRDAQRRFATNRQTESLPELTVAEFLSRGRYSREFAEHYLLPMGSAIWSCPAEAFAHFPVNFIIEFFHNHGLLSLRDRPTWRVVEGGSRNYVRAMAAKFGPAVDVRLRTPVQQVRRRAEFVEITTRNAGMERFDHVIFACHADQALRMLDDPTRTERDLLSAFRYERSTALLHVDTSILPKNRQAWASWNYRVTGHCSRRSTVTYCMNLLQHLRSEHVFNVTLNGEALIDPRKVLGRYAFEHPVFTLRRKAAQSRWGELHAARRTSYCGAYWGNGFHEDGVASAMAVCQALSSRTEDDPTLSSPGTAVLRAANAVAAT